MAIKELVFADHEEWLVIRSRYIGGSDAAAVVGMNPYKSAYTLWAEKTGRIEGFTGNLTTKTGAYLEEFVAKLFEEETGKKVRKKNRTMINDEYPFACANIDRAVVGENAILEIKTTNSIPLMKKLRNSDEFPEQYYCQVVHYLAVTGKQKAYLAVLINCRDFKVYELERDENEIAALMNAEREFWEYVKSDTAPVADGSESTGKTISEQYPVGNPGEQADLLGYEKDIEQYMDISAQIKTLTEIKDGIANRVKAYMGEASFGYAGAYKVSYSSSERNTFDSKKFVKDHPDTDLTGYYKTTAVRTFKVTEA